MGANLSDFIRNRNATLSDSDRIKPSSEQRTPKHRDKLVPLAFVPSKFLSKLSFKRKRGSKENVKYFRELISSWPLSDLVALYKDFETSKLIGELRTNADSARPKTLSVGEELFASQATDCKIIVKGERFEVHKFFIEIRCEILKALISNDKTEIVLDDPPFPCDSHDIRDFIYYVHTEKWSKCDKLLNSLKKWTGCYNTLADDLQSLEKVSSSEGDVTAILSHTSKKTNFLSTQVKEYELKCHMGLMAARSRMLSNLLKERKDRIVLEEALLPRAFAPALLHFIYTDELSLNMISDSNSSQSSLSEARAIVSGRSPNSSLNKAIQLLQIAKFFNLYKLVELCEDVIVSQLCSETSVAVLCWALDGGSSFVARQTQRFIEYDFMKIAQTHHIFELDINTMLSCVSSQFTQATEIEILEAVIKWGEHDLLKRMEDREPNIVVDTTHSISRRGVRRADLNSSELSEILKPLASCVRTDLILPPFHQSLTNAYRRGIIERAPLRNLMCSSSSDINPDIQWFRPDDLSPGPRFYQPYFEELKSRIDSLADVQSNESVWRPLNVKLHNVLPDLISDSLFNEVKTKILTEIALFDSIHHLRDLRYFHKKSAVDFISLRILREMDVPVECIEVSLDELPKQESIEMPDIMAHESR